MDSNRKAFTISVVVLLILLFSVFGIILQYELSSESNKILFEENVEIFIQPNEGRTPLLNLIESAVKSIDLEIYNFADKEVQDALIEAKKRGVNVRVIIEQEVFGGLSQNSITKERLNRYGIDIVWDNRVYVFTHSKFLIIDGKTALIMTMNITKSAFTENREFGVIVKNKATVAELSRVFQADWERRPYRPKKSSLVVSPESSRVKLESLLSCAKKEVLMYVPSMDDARLKAIIKKLSQKGVKVYCITGNPASDETNKYLLSELKGYGVNAGFITSPFVHAKVIVVDRAICYLGSINFTTNSIDNNREVGIIISDREAVRDIVKQFLEDYSKSFK